jgi:hypothetical protein
MKTKGRLITARKNEGSSLEIFIYHDTILISGRNRREEIEELAKSLKKRGLNLKEEFNSPCG